MPAGWDAAPTAQPLAPQNGQVISTYIPGSFDLRWDDPALLGGNSQFTVIGVNVYRSDVSDRGPYFRVNEFPVGGCFYRDQTDIVPITETVQDASWVARGDAANDRRWVFKTTYAIAKRGGFGPYNEKVYANAPSDVTVTVDDVPVPAAFVDGHAGEVTLVNQPTLNVVTEKFEAVPLPGTESTVVVTYFTYRNFVRSGLDTKVYYRFATVILDASTPEGLRENDLTYSKPCTVYEVETLDYIWREAVRRNQWILQQGGERAKLFIRRGAGMPCYCRLESLTREFSQQPSQRCAVCFGTGFVGGYDGPYDILIAPDDAERRISQSPFGRRKEHTYEVWTGPSPILTQRDFIVKQTNERYSIGPVRRPNNRGNILQQHFNIAYFDEQDIRYRVPIDGVTAAVYPETRFSDVQAPALPVDGTPAPWPAGAPYPTAPGGQAPQISEESDVPAGQQQRGRTPAWKNVTY